MSDESRQPTMDELRQRAVAGCLRYAGTIGAGPEGTTCHSCKHLRYTGLAVRSKYPKCGLTNYTHGDATTIKTRTPSCERYEADKPSPGAPK